MYSKRIFLVGAHKCQVPTYCIQKKDVVLNIAVPLNTFKDLRNKLTTVTLLSFLIGITLPDRADPDISSSTQPLEKF
mgnify:CR=1 FL=1